MSWKWNVYRVPQKTKILFSIVIVFVFWEAFKEFVNTKFREDENHLCS